MLGESIEQISRRKGGVVSASLRTKLISLLPKLRTWLYVNVTGCICMKTSGNCYRPPVSRVQRYSPLGAVLSAPAATEISVWPSIHLRPTMG